MENMQRKISVANPGRMRNRNNVQAEDKITEDEAIKLEKYIKISHYLDKDIITHQAKNKENKFDETKVEEEKKQEENEDLLLNLLKDMKKKPIKNNDQFLLNGEVMKIEGNSKKKKGKKRINEQFGIQFIHNNSSKDNYFLENNHNKEFLESGNDILMEKISTFKFEEPRIIFHKENDDEILKKKNELEDAPQKPGPCNACIGF
jgi:hypothetical protein